MCTGSMRIGMACSGTNSPVRVVVSCFGRAGAFAAASMLTAVLAFTPISTSFADGTLATLIQLGDRDAALEMIESGADVQRGPRRRHHAATLGRLSE